MLRTRFAEISAREPTFGTVEGSVPSIILECPYCGAEKIGFGFAAEVVAYNGPPNTRRYFELMTCSNYANPVTAIFHSAGNAPYSGPNNCPSDPTKLGYELIDTYPKPRAARCPKFTPDDLRRIFLQAENALRRGDPDASGAMSRKVMDVSTQRLIKQFLGEGVSEKYRTIFDRIEALAADYKLTPELRDWAHQLRLGGADAAHDLDPFTIPEADELLDIAELYLTYLYTLPERLRLRQDRAKAEKEKAAQQAARASPN
jgi:hypothetical protein